MSSAWAYVVMLLVIAGGFYALGYLSAPGERVTTVQSVDTVQVTRAVTDTVVRPVFRLVRRVDTVRLVERVNRDSLWQEALRYWEAHNALDEPGLQYLAAMDTTYQDSTLSARISFISPLPLHPGSYFDYDISIRTTRLTERVTQDESFWRHRFNVNIGAGIAYDLYDREFVPAVSLIASVRLF